MLNHCAYQAKILETNDFDTARRGRVALQLACAMSQEHDAAEVGECRELSLAKVVIVDCDHVDVCGLTKFRPSAEIHIGARGDEFPVPYIDLLDQVRSFMLHVAAVSDRWFRYNTNRGR